MRMISELIQMKKSLYWLSKTISYLEITILSAIAVIISVKTVMAKPLCYLVDANGRRVNLNYLCEKQKKIPQTTVQTEKTPSPQPDLTPETLPNSSIENQTEATDNNNQPSIQPESTKEEEKIDSSKLAPAQKTVPLPEK